jgi:Gas vesicle protein G
MGLIVGLLTLPLAPVRGTAWIAEKMLEQAENELYDEDVILRKFMELEMDRDAGTIDAAEAEAIEEELFERLMTAREMAAQKGR